MAGKPAPNGPISGKDIITEQQKKREQQTDALQQKGSKAENEASPDQAQTAIQRQSTSSASSNPLGSTSLSPSNPSTTLPSSETRQGGDSKESDAMVESTRAQIELELSKRLDRKLAIARSGCLWHPKPKDDAFFGSLAVSLPLEWGGQCFMVGETWQLQNDSGRKAKFECYIVALLHDTGLMHCFSESDKCRQKDRPHWTMNLKDEQDLLKLSRWKFVGVVTEPAMRITLDSKRLRLSKNETLPNADQRKSVRKRKNKGEQEEINDDEPSPQKPNANRNSKSSKAANRKSTRKVGTGATTGTPEEIDTEEEPVCKTRGGKRAKAEKMSAAVLDLLLTKMREERKEDMLELQKRQDAEKLEAKQAWSHAPPWYFQTPMMQPPLKPEEKKTRRGKKRQELEKGPSAPVINVAFSPYQQQQWHWSQPTIPYPQHMNLSQPQGPTPEHMMPQQQLTMSGAPYYCYPQQASSVHPQQSTFHQQLQRGPPTTAPPVTPVAPTQQYSYGVPSYQPQQQPMATPIQGVPSYQPHHVQPMATLMPVVSSYQPQQQPIATPMQYSPAPPFPPWNGTPGSCFG